MTPTEFLIKDEFGGTTTQDYQDLCLWLVENGSDDDLIIGVAACGIHWQELLRDQDYILDQAGIGGLSTAEKLKRIEVGFVQHYKDGKLSLIDLIKKMNLLCLKNSAYDELGIWFALEESLCYYDNSMGTLFYKLNPRKLMESAEEFLRKNGRI